jgi:tryptophanyl-tRNA synthetase
MTIQDLKIGQTVYLINEQGRVWKKNVIKIDTDSFVINATYKENKFGDRIEIDNPYTKIEVAYNRHDKVFYCLSENDAVVYKKKAIVDLINIHIKLVEENYEKVKKIRRNYHDLLNTKDIDKWVLDFKNNSNW